MLENPHLTRGLRFEPACGEQELERATAVVVSKPSKMLQEERFHAERHVRNAGPPFTGTWHIIGAQ